MAARRRKIRSPHREVAARTNEHDTGGKKKWSLRAKLTWTVVTTICVIITSISGAYIHNRDKEYNDRKTKAQTEYDRWTKDLNALKDNKDALRIALGRASFVQNMEVPVPLDVLKRSSWQRKETKPNMESVRAIIVAHSQYLSGVDLSFADLRGIDLSEAKLQDAECHGTIFAGAHMRGADLSGAKLDNASLEWADLREARMTKAVLSGADLSCADLRGAVLDRAILMPIITFYAARTADFDLSPNNTSRFELYSKRQRNDGIITKAARLDEAKLDGASFKSANLIGVDLTKVDTTHAIMDNTYVK